MAIYNGPMASKMRGKVGEIVAAKTVGGQTALRAYQPNVKNPNTKRQQVSRGRFSVASKLAASLGEAINIGYAMACKGMKMYPRNVFVRDIVPMGDNDVILFDGVDFSVSYGYVKVAKRAGISEVPSVGSLDLTVAGKISVPVTVPEPSFDLQGGSMGVIVVALFPDAGVSVVEQTAVVAGTASTVQIDVPAQLGGETVHVYAFSKVVPATHNNISTEEEPWKYPSETSDSVYVGTGNVH